MNRAISILLLFAVFNGYAFSQDIKIKGQLIDCDTLMILLKSSEGCDTVFTNDGKFEIDKHLAYPDLFSIICVKGKQSIEAIRQNNERKMRSLEDGVSRSFFLEGGEMLIHSTFKEFKDLDIKRSQHIAQDKFNEFQNRFNLLVDMARSLIDSSFAPKRTISEKELCKNLLNRIIQIEEEVAEQFVLENTDNIVGAYVLYRYCQLDEYQKLDSFYRSFSSNLKNAYFLKEVKNKIYALAQLKVGNQVRPFSAITSKGDSLHLASFKGKYIVIDFWGTWCPPCIKDIPTMKAYYTKYKTKLEMIGIACNENESKWRDFIHKHGMDWPQIINDKEGNDLSKMYNVTSFPTKILIDGNFNLVGLFTENGEAFYQKLDSLFGNKSK